MDFDLLIIGGGHNGLTTAALQAGRGRRVLVLERAAQLGGVAAREEICDGFSSAGVLHDTAGVRPSVVEALELQSHGLQRRSVPTPVFAPQLEGRGLYLVGDPAADAAEIAAHSKVDGARWRDYLAFGERVAPLLRGLVDAPPPDIVPRGLGQYWDLLRRGWALRGLGPETMHELLRVGPMSLADHLDEWFETDLLKALLAGPALLGTFTGPRAAGTAILGLLQRSTEAGEIAGGPAALVDALAAACTSRGVQTRTGVEVRRILVEAGRVRGVELADGAVVRCARVASSIDPRRTFLDLIAPADLPPGLADALPAWRCRGTTAKIDLALDGPLEFACRPEVKVEAARIGLSLTELEQAFDPVKYRAMPAVPHLDVRVPTFGDPRLAPQGHHVVSMLVHFVPFDLDGGWDDARRQELFDVALARLAAFAPGVRDRIVGHRVRTPADLERDFGLTGGHVHHGEHGLDQLFSLRPHPRCARYATPLPGLFLCGSGSHPGGGITCAPGALAAARMR